MSTTAFLPTPPTSGGIIQSGYDNNCLEELITNNNIADNSRAILAAISNSTASIIAADQAAHLQNLKATGDASVAGINATNLAGVSGIKATSDASVANLKATGDSAISVTKTVSDGIVAGINATNLNGVSVTKNITDAALAAALANAEARELIGTAATTNLMAIKDNLFAIKDEGCKTREKSAEQYAVLLLESCKNTDKIEKELLKGFANTQLEALKNKCELAAQIAECCCAQEKQAAETRALILSESNRRTEAENANLRLELLLLKK